MKRSDLKAKSDLSFYMTENPNGIILSLLLFLPDIVL